MTKQKMPLRYFGGKWLLAPWIVEHFPEHRCYVEPFAGGASVLFRKPEAPAEVLNDIDGEVVNFWDVLRTQTHEFLHQVETTPFSRAVAKLALRPATTPMERARRFYIQACQLRAGTGGKWLTGWRYGRGINRFHTPSHDWAKQGHLLAVAERLRRVQLEHDDFAKVIRRFDSVGTLFYCDQPYLSTTRGRWGTCSYRHELRIEDHERLAKLLQTVRGAVVLSGYPSPLYARLYRGWKMVRKAVTLCHNDSRMKRVECLWIKETKR